MAAAKKDSGREHSGPAASKQAARKGGHKPVGAQQGKNTASPTVQRSAANAGQPTHGGIPPTVSRAAANLQDSL
jgi:hypothetical protein